MQQSSLLTSFSRWLSPSLPLWIHSRIGLACERTNLATLLRKERTRSINGEFPWPAHLATHTHTHTHTHTRRGIQPRLIRRDGRTIPNSDTRFACFAKRPAFRFATKSRSDAEEASPLKSPLKPRDEHNRVTSIQHARFYIRRAKSATNRHDDRGRSDQPASARLRATGSQ